MSPLRIRCCRCWMSAEYQSGRNEPLTQGRRKRLPHLRLQAGGRRAFEKGWAVEMNAADLRRGGDRPAGLHGADGGCGAQRVPHRRGRRHRRAATALCRARGPVPARRPRLALAAAVYFRAAAALVGRAGKNERRGAQPHHELQQKNRRASCRRALHGERGTGRECRSGIYRSYSRPLSGGSSRVPPDLNVRLRTPAARNQGSALWETGGVFAARWR
jgi:hypothetical protein